MRKAYNCVSYSEDGGPGIFYKRDLLWIKDAIYEQVVRHARR